VHLCHGVVRECCGRTLGERRSEDEHVRICRPSSGLGLTATVTVAAVTLFSLSARTEPTPPFAALVDEYMDQFALRHPSIAAGNGFHGHDDRLEDFSAAAIAAEVAWLHAFAARVHAIDPQALTADERVDRHVRLGILDGWLLD